MRSRRAKIARVLFAVSLCAAAHSPAPARACGKCLEDKIAATWDFSVLTRAARDRHVVVFTEVLGPAAGAGAALEQFIARVLAATPGIDVGTVRVSLDPPAASFACDPARYAPRSLMAAVNPRLAARRLSLTIIKIDRGVRTKSTAGTVGANPSRRPGRL